MKFKISKKVKVISLIGIIFVLLGYASYKLYFEKIYIFKENEKLFLASVQNYFKINKTFVPSVGDYKNLSLQDMYDNALIEALYIPKSDKFCNEDNSFVRVINEKGTLRYITYLECGKFKSDVDHTSPVVVLNGDNKVIVHLYDNYQELGVKTVVDDYDGVIDNTKVEVLSNVDTSKPGNYTVTYKIYDNNFNVTREVRDVVVADTLNNVIKRDTNNTNIYKGNVDNNYLLFSGMMFRIVKINDDNTVKIVSDDNISHLSYNEEKYQGSNLEKWLNDYYYNNLNEESKKYIVKSKWCTGNVVDINNFTCTDIINNNIGLLNIKEYQDTITNRLSYLNGPASVTLLLNKKDPGILYMTGINSLDIQEGDSNLLYPSVKPSINLKENSYIVRGNGTIDNPYMLGDYEYGRENDLLNTRLIGEYVNFSGYLCRISNIDKDGNIELIMMEELKNQTTDETIRVIPSEIENYRFNVDDENNIGYHLNNDYINYLNNKYLVKHEFIIPTTTRTNTYDNFEITKIQAKLSLPYTYQMFSSYSGDTYKSGVRYLLSDYSEVDNKIFMTNTATESALEVLTDAYYRYEIRCVMYLNKDVKIASGSGTSTKPYYIK